MPSYSETGDGARSNQMQDYSTMRKELKDLLSKKRTLDKTLNNLEEQIYKYEGTYLEETQNGNIVRGFDNYIKGGLNKRRATISDKERIFSLSSAAFMKARMKEENEKA